MNSFNKPTFCLLLVFAMSQLGIYAQYLAFPDSGAVWKVDEFNSDISFDCGGTITTIYTAQDTIQRGGQVFQKIQTLNSGDCSVALSSTCFPLGTMPGLRTDTSTGMVYAWGQQGFEVPLFDYSLQPGDTMWTYLNGLSAWWGSVVLVDSVDTVVLGGLARKRLFLDSFTYPFHPDVIIEGIGPSFGLFVPPYIGANGEYGNLSCYSESGIPIFQDPDACSYANGGTCISVSSFEPVAKTGLELYPNPASTNIRLRHASLAVSVVEVCDVYGKSLLVWENDSGLPGAEIDISGLPSGVFVLKCQYLESREWEAVSLLVGK